MCNICHIQEATAIDHNHKTGEVRGYLCGNCNWGLGQFQDSIPLLEAAIEYLFLGGWQADYTQQQLG
jgi:hypothetical protein